MSVKFYQFGKIVGGTGPNGNIIPAEASYGPPETFEGTLPAGDTTITPSTYTKSVHILNTHDNITLEYSFDGGVDWFGIQPYGEVKEPVAVSDILLRGAGCTYEVTFALQEP